MKHRLTFLATLLAVLPLQTFAQHRVTTSIRQWQFSRDSLHWQTVTIPHDWAISGPFDKKWDLQMVAIEQNGEKEKTEKSGRSGALPWIGEGYYTTTVDIHKAAAATDGGKEPIASDRDKGFAKRYTLCFDGAMAEPTVYVNGQRAGFWAYGYTPFRIDITPYLKEGANTITVHLHNRGESSRWYPGAGLYRPVTLVETATTCLDPWATFVSTDTIFTRSAGAKQYPVARLSISTKLNSTLSQSELAGHYSVKIQLSKPDGKRCWEGSVGGAHPQFGFNNDGSFNLRLNIPNPRLWSPESPSLYTLRLTLLKDGSPIDEISQKVGIRTISIDAEHGFRLNGVPRKFQGVCLHHDLGPLGAAVNKAALIRQVKLLKTMGTDAIRTSHNLPSQMQMEVYDSLGMMVMGESFDMWIYPKCKNGYARFFKGWSDKDITRLVLANRNHPSLVMYSIGNEIPEQWSEEGREISRHLQDLCHRLDPTRPVTQGMDKAEDALKSGFAQVMDVPGFNYRVYKYDRSMKQLTTGFLLGSETASTVSSRGVYKFPVEFKIAHNEGDGQVSSYDTDWCSWSNLPEEDFMAMEDKPYTIGQFVWTGFDYLGEPTPYDEYWPSRSSYFGIFDLAGLPKDRYYLYRSVWNKDEHTLHILPHWTWPGREGQVTPVFVYTDYPEAELFINGKSQGRQRKAVGLKTDDQNPSTPEVAKARATRYRLMWDNVVYEPGEVRVVAYDANGQKAGETSVRTAGKAADIKLEVDTTTLVAGCACCKGTKVKGDYCKDIVPTIKADGDDLAYITVSLVDKDGTELPTATDNIEVEVTGAGTFRGICNGDATSTEVFTEPHMHLFSGKLVVTVQAGQEKGDITVKVTDREAGLEKTIILRAE